MSKKSAIRTPDPVTGHLSCGCRVGFRVGVEGSPVTVVVVAKSTGCAVASHVGGLPIFDHRDARRPATRALPAVQPDYEN
jgi:hypothetical protein